MKKYLFLSITSLLLASFMVACEDEDTPSKSDFDIEYVFITIEQPKLIRNIRV